MSIRPARDEYPDYFERYVNMVPEGDIYNILAQSLIDIPALFAHMEEEKGNYRYAPDRWSVKQVLGHLCDNERIMSYRLLRIARGDNTTPHAGYDQNLLMNGADYDSMSLTQIMEDFGIARKSTLSLLKGISEEAFSRRGIVSNRESSARAWPYIIAGHELHHINVIKDKYLNV